MVGQDPCIRVVKCLHAMEKAFNNNWTPGDVLASDEHSQSGARSRHCNIGMCNASKPGPAHHIDLQVMADAFHNCPLHMCPFRKTGVPMSDIVLESCWNSDWNDQGRWW